MRKIGSPRARIERERSRCADRQDRLHHQYSRPEWQPRAVHERRCPLSQAARERVGRRESGLLTPTTRTNPDKARQLAQELVVRDKVNPLAGVIFTPNRCHGARSRPSKVPFVIMNAHRGDHTRSPYMVRTSFTLWQSTYPLGQWASKKFKTRTRSSRLRPRPRLRGRLSAGVRGRRRQVVGKVRVAAEPQTGRPI